MIMNLLAAFIGYSAFVLTILAIGGLGYYYADDLERWTKHKLGKEWRLGWAVHWVFRINLPEPRKLDSPLASLPLPKKNIQSLST